MWCSNALSPLSVCWDTGAENALALQRVLVSLVLSLAVWYAFLCFPETSLKQVREPPWCAMWMCVFQTLFPYCSLQQNSFPRFYFPCLKARAPKNTRCACAVSLFLCLVQTKDLRRDHFKFDSCFSVWLCRGTKTADPQAHSASRIWHVVCFLICLCRLLELLLHDTTMLYANA